MQTLAFLPNFGTTEMVILLVVMLLLFGRRLPEVGRSLGQGIVSFKKGLKDVTDEIDVAAQGSQQGGGNPPQFDSVRSPNNPDMMGTAHVSATPSASGSASVSEGDANGDASKGA